jgi:transcriptional accessory protein Tex/SPT6
VLALQRGADQKILKLSYEIDSARAEESTIRCALVMSGILGDGKHNYIWKEAIHDAWSRLVQKRCTSRLWKTYCLMAEEHAIEVFCNNLRKALLAPPATNISPVVFALDFGFQAGIKCALLDTNGQLLTNQESALSTVSFMRDYEKGKQQMIELLQSCQPNTNGKVVVAWHLGMGTGHKKHAS